MAKVEAVPFCRFQLPLPHSGCIAADYNEHQEEIKMIKNLSLRKDYADTAFYFLLVRYRPVTN